MIDYREIDSVIDDGYEIFKDKDGVIYKVTLPTQKDLIKVGKFQFMITELEKSYKNITNRKQTEKAFDDMDNIYKKLTDIVIQMFLFILNLNTEGRTFTKEEIKMVTFEAAQQECNAYMKYVESKMGN